MFRRRIKVKLEFLFEALFLYILSQIIFNIIFSMLFNFACIETHSIIIKNNTFSFNFTTYINKPGDNPIKPFCFVKRIIFRFFLPLSLPILLCMHYFFNNRSEEPAQSTSVKLACKNHPWDTKIVAVIYKSQLL